MLTSSLRRGTVAAALLVGACSDPTSLTTEPGTGGTGGDVEPGFTCIAFCLRAVGDCGAVPFTEAVCRDSCQMSLDTEYAQDEACGMAAEDTFLCATALECDELIEWLPPRSPDDVFPCQAEVEVFDDLINDGTCLPPQ